MLKDIAKVIADQEKAKAEQVKRLDEKNEENFKRVFVKENLPHLKEINKYDLEGEIKRLRIIKAFYKEVAELLHESTWIDPSFYAIRREDVHVSYKPAGWGQLFSTALFSLPNYLVRLYKESGERILDCTKRNVNIICSEDEIYKRRLFKKARIDVAVDDLNGLTKFYRENAIAPYQYVVIRYEGRSPYNRFMGKVVLFSDGDVYESDDGSDLELCPFKSLEYNMEDLNDEDKRKEMAFRFALKILESKEEPCISVGETPLFSLEFFRKGSKLNYQEIVEKYNIK